MSFANHLVALRRARGLSQAELASATGLGAPTVSRYERGLAPSLEHVVKLAGALGADSTELLKLAAVQVETRAAVR
jgi:transcriptional regulator with XRE-family HTH domain